MSLTFRRWNSGLSFATEPSSVVHTGMKSLGCENSTAHESPIHSWNRSTPSVVCTTKSGAVSPSWRPIVVSFPRAGGADEARAGPPGRGRSAGGQAELAEDVGQVAVDRVLAQEEPPGDVRVAQSLRDQLQHVDFTGRQHRRGLTRAGGVVLAHRRTGALLLAPRLPSVQSLVSHASRVEAAA